ncbi:MAG: metallophosphoesterase family protein [Myxococcota bacterium]
MKRLVVIAICITAASCALRPAQTRAELDEQVGKTEVAATSWEVRDGLAQFVDEQPGELTLWAQAPMWSLEADPADASTTTWRLRLNNVMPDGELDVVDGDATVARVDQPHPTRQVWDVTLDADGPARFEFAPPDALTAEKWRFAALSDVQEAIGTVGEIFARINADERIRFVVSSGDITDIGSAEELSRFQDELRALDVPFYTTTGNHEEGSPDDVWPKLFGRTNFHFDFKGTHFSFVDSGSGTVDPLVYDWLDGWLAHARDDVHVFIAHIAPIDPVGVRNGSFRSRHEAAKLQQMLAEGRVDLSLHGHVHSYYLFERAGVPSYISGGGGAIPERFDGIDRHFLVVDVAPSSGVDSVGVVRVD